MLLGLLFYVSCRENEAYLRFRENSARALRAYKPDVLPSVLNAVRQRGYVPGDAILTIITMSHDADLLRTLPQDVYDGIANTWIPFIGAESAEHLKRLALQAVLDTGDRVWGNDENNRDYLAELFIPNSTDIGTCVSGTLIDAIEALP